MKKEVKQTGEKKPGFFKKVGGIFLPHRNLFQRSFC